VVNFSINFSIPSIKKYRERNLIFIYLPYLIREYNIGNITRAIRLPRRERTDEFYTYSKPMTSILDYYELATESPSRNKA